MAFNVLVRTCSARSHLPTCSSAAAKVSRWLWSLVLVFWSQTVNISSAFWLGFPKVVSFLIQSIAFKDKPSFMPKLLHLLVVHWERSSSSVAVSSPAISEESPERRNTDWMASRFGTFNCQWSEKQHQLLMFIQSFNGHPKQSSCLRNAINCYFDGPPMGAKTKVWAIIHESGCTYCDVTWCERPCRIALFLLF